MTVAPHMGYEFGPFRIDPERQLILRDGQPLAMAPKVFAVLLALVRRNREVVRKDELLQDVWPGRVVEEANLSQCVFMLRKLLGDTDARRRYIITLPGMGYRFVEPVRTCVTDDREDPATAAVQQPAPDGTAAEGASAEVDPYRRVDDPISLLRPEAATTDFLAGVRSIAVLPFSGSDDANGQPDFADGLSESLITSLSQFAGIHVIQRDSAFQFRGTSDSPASAGAILGATHVLTGAVWRLGGNVKIQVALVDVADGSNLWSKRYDQPFDQLFALQDAIATSIADTLCARPLVAPGAVMQSDRPSNGSLAAWIAFQQGNGYAALGTATSAQQAIAAYDRAIRLDAAYAPAYAGLCNAWIDRWSAAGVAATRTIGESLANARAAASIALRLNPSSSMAHLAHARLLLADMDWEGAKAEATVALRLAPNDTAAQFGLAVALATLGQTTHATTLLHKALVGDPRHAAWYKWLSMFLAALGQLDAARNAAVTAISLQPSAADFHAQLTLVDVLRGDSIAALESAINEIAGVWRQIAVALALQAGSDQTVADAALDALIAEHAEDAAYQIAEVYALRGAADEVFEWLERAWRVRDGGMGSLLFDPLLLRYRVDPRFAVFCRKVGLPAIEVRCTIV